MFCKQAKQSRRGRGNSRAGEEIIRDLRKHKNTAVLLCYTKPGQRATDGRRNASLLNYKRQKCHEASALHCVINFTLMSGRNLRSTLAHDARMRRQKALQIFNIFIVYVEWYWLLHIFKMECLLDLQFPLDNELRQLAFFQQCLTSLLLLLPLHLFHLP